MAKALKILTNDNPKEDKILREKSEYVPEEEIKSKEFQDYLDNLLETAKKSKIPAAGIASPQVGVLKRVFYTLNYDTNEWQEFINPEIEPTNLAKTSIEEECLSVPGKIGKVLRYANIKIKFMDRNGEKKCIKYTGLNAVTLQHENDHLDGILFIDKIIK